MEKGNEHTSALTLTQWPSESHSHRRVALCLEALRLVIAILVIAAVSIISATAKAEAIPKLQRNGQATQLMVAGTPYLILGGELHNSSGSSPVYMKAIWPQLKNAGVHTVIGTASWELVEPTEGHYDFTAVDDQIRNARANNMRLVLIWFGAYKNAESTYAPSWVRRDEVRFPRAERDPQSPVKGIYAGPGPVLSVFNKTLVRSDQRAFSTLMAHLRKVDIQRTVIMVQVENEVGLLGDSRDRSLLADAAWHEQVPPKLIDYLHTHKADLRPPLAAAWASHGWRESGSWAEIFGTDRTAEEIFMAWGFGSYAEQIAKAGTAQYPLPMYVNAWLGPQPGAAEPGQYPSGGPVGQMMDIWKAAAPSIAFLSPDIYVDDFAGTLMDYHRANNPIFIPEARFDAGNLFVAIGEYRAIGFSPFGIEDAKENDSVLATYAALAGMNKIITNAQADGRIRGFKLAGFEQTVKLGNYTFRFTRPTGTLGAFGPGTGETAAKPLEAYGVLLQMDADTFIVLARGVTLDLSGFGAGVEIDTAEEGHFESGRWFERRRLNGDELRSLIPQDHLGMIKIRLLRRP